MLVVFIFAKIVQPPLVRRPKHGNKGVGQLINAAKKRKRHFYRYLGVLDSHLLNLVRTWIHGINEG